MARQLEGVRDKDSGDGIQIALRQTDGMRENVSHLNDVKGSDSTANAIVDHYPGYIDAFVDAAKAEVRSCRYRPGRIGGRPVRVRVQQPVDFQVIR